jgi:hypothetical protein
MDTTTLKTLTELAGTLTTTMFLFFAWYQERNERLKRTDDMLAHYEKHHTKPSEEPQ